MRGRKAAINTAFNLTEELVSVICGLILPRLILSFFGSEYNGLTQSITQFMSVAVLLRAGIGGATRASLYKPLAEKDKSAISAIVNATDKHMKKIAGIFLVIIVVLACVYPLMVSNEFGWLFTFSLFLIIGASTFAESFFGLTYLMVLQADQKVWVSSAMRIVCYILNTIIAVALILNGSTIHIVKLGSAFVYVLYPIVLGMYVRRKYQIDRSIAPNMKALAQRWDAFWHQVSVFVMNNTDVMVLTAFTNMFEVSVYSVYNMVMHGLRRVIMSFSNSQEAAFGNMIAKDQYDILRENVSAIEIVMYSLSTVVYTATAVLILDFVGIYTAGITDVNYIRPIFAFVIILAHFFNGVRIPYQMVVQAAGHYKQTRNGAIFEPILNIVLSIIFVFHFGLVGVAVGTLAATVFRTIQFSTYMSKNIVVRSRMIALVRCLVSIGEAAVIIAVMYFLPLPTPTNYLWWAVKAVITLAIALVVVLGGNYLFFRKDTKLAIRKLKNIFRRRGRKKSKDAGNNV